MSIPSIASLFFKDRPEEYEAIKKLDDKAGNNLFRKLHEDRDTVNFYSWLTEMKFGSHFKSLGFELQYEHVIASKKIDWILSQNDQKIFAEVLRLNPEETGFLKQIREYEERVTQGDDYAGRMYVSGAMSSEYFYGHLTKIVKKELKYRNLIEEYQTAFIICVDCSNNTLFLDTHDFRDYFIDDRKKGYFYTAAEFGKNVSGLLIRNMWGQTIYLCNLNAQHQLNSNNMSLFEVIS